MITKWKANDGFALIDGKITAATMASMSLTKADATLTELQQKQMAKGFLELIAGWNGLAGKIEVNNAIDEASPFSIDEFVETQENFLYKYISEGARTFYERGLFQVGSVNYFKIMENEKARDELEGLAIINTKMGSRTATCGVTMGANYYIFCSSRQTTDALSDYHVASFGPVLMKIELAPFAERMAKRLGAVSYKVMNVKYANAKLIHSELPFEMTPEACSDWNSSEMQQYLKHLIADCTTSCLFTKPGWFKDEVETRIVFEMPYDVNPKLPKRFEVL